MASAGAQQPSASERVPGHTVPERGQWGPRFSAGPQNLQGLGGQETAESSLEGFLRWSLLLDTGLQERAGSDINPQRR